VLADFINAVSAEIPGVPSLIGAEHLAANATPPRLVWVPTTDRFDGAEKGGSISRSMRTRVAGVDLHIWGDDLAAAETLLHQAVSAVHRVAYGSYEVLAGRWLTDDGRELLLKGRVYVLSLAVRMPVTDALTKATVTQIVETKKMAFPAGDVTNP
jgi:hypothetical protein